MMAATILNSRGEPIVLNTLEQRRCDIIQRQANDLGYEVQITTLTSISKKISEEKFFEIAPADYLPVQVGEGAWSSNLTTYRSFDVASEFEEGMVNTGGQNARLATADAAVDALNLKIFNWAKSIGYSIMDLEQASKSGNWDLVSSKEKARKRNWDLGIQRVAFLGARGQNASGGSCLGLLNQSVVNVNTSVITKPIKSMSPTELNAFTGAILETYRENNQRTAWPTHFIMPESDYNGCANQASDTFPLKTKLQILEETFQIITRNKSFKILPLAYGDAQYSGYAYNTYVLLNYAEDSLKMVIPVDYTNTLANSIDNFSFQNVGYGQFTGVQVIRPLEMLYFRYTPA